MSNLRQRRAMADESSAPTGVDPESGDDPTAKVHDNDGAPAVEESTDPDRKDEAQDETMELLVNEDVEGEESPRVDSEDPTESEAPVELELLVEDDQETTKPDHAVEDKEDNSEDNSEDNPTDAQEEPVTMELLVDDDTPSGDAAVPEEEEEEEEKKEDAAVDADSDDNDTVFGDTTTKDDSTHGTDELVEIELPDDVSAPFNATATTYEVVTPAALSTAEDATTSVLLGATAPPTEEASHDGESLVRTIKNGSETMIVQLVPPDSHNSSVAAAINATHTYEILPSPPPPNSNPTTTTTTATTTTASESSVLLGATAPPSVANDNQETTEDGSLPTTTITTGSETMIVQLVPPDSHNSSVAAAINATHTYEILPPPVGDTRSATMAPGFAQADPSNTTTAVGSDGEEKDTVDQEAVAPAFPSCYVCGASDAAPSLLDPTVRVPEYLHLHGQDDDQADGARPTPVVEDTCGSLQTMALAGDLSEFACQMIQTGDFYQTVCECQHVDPGVVVEAATTAAKTSVNATVPGVPALSATTTTTAPAAPATHTASLLRTVAPVAAPHRSVPTVTTPPAPAAAVPLPTVPTRRVTRAPTSTSRMTRAPAGFPRPDNTRPSNVVVPVRPATNNNTIAQPSACGSSHGAESREWTMACQLEAHPLRSAILVLLTILIVGYRLLRCCCCGGRSSGESDDMGRSRGAYRRVASRFTADAFDDAMGHEDDYLGDEDYEDLTDAKGYVIEMNKLDGGKLSLEEMNG